MSQLEVLVEAIVERVAEKLNDFSFEVEASGRHIHLSRKEIDALFGKDYSLTKAKDLSQPGQFACKERLTLVGPKGQFQNVVVLGPEREATQVEISLTDSRVLGINCPIRESGHIQQTPGVTLIHGEKVVTLSQGLIVAKRHVHMTPEDAKKNKVENGEIVQVAIDSVRKTIFDDVVIRVSSKFATFMHIDYDEANAVGLTKGVRGKIIKKL